MTNSYKPDLVYRVAEAAFTTSLIEDEDRWCIQREVAKSAVPSVLMPAGFFAMHAMRHGMPPKLQPFFELKRGMLWFTPLWLGACFWRQTAMMRRIEPLARKYADVL